MPEARNRKIAGGAGVGAGRCLVLIAPGEPAPTPLLVGLARRRLAAVVVAEAPAVMMHLSEAPAVAVILTEPDRQPVVAELAAAVRRYYPRTQVWQYRAGDGVDGVDGGAAARGLTRLNGTYDVSGPVSRQAQQNAAKPGPVATPTNQAVPPAARADPPDEPLISSEELAMLLGPNGDDVDLPEGSA